MNGILPGAGLWYLGRPGRAVANFALAAVITVLGGFYAQEKFHYICLAVVAGSAGYAHAFARSQRTA